MWKRLECALWLVIGVLAPAGCGQDPVNATPVPQAPRFILVAHGNEQEVTAHTVVREPLIARVVDADWKGVPNVEVRWTTDSGTRLLTYPDRHALNQSAMVTDRYGNVAVYVQTFREGPIKVVATAAVENSRAEFEVIGVTPNRRTIVFGPDLECEGQSAFLGTPTGNFEVFVGAAVTFTLAENPWGPCAGRVVSIQFPEGGESFDSEVLFSGASFRFTPNVPGTWVFRDVINGGEGRMTAKVP